MWQVYELIDDNRIMKGIIEVTDGLSRMDFTKEVCKIIGIEYSDVFTATPVVEMIQGSLIYVYRRDNGENVAVIEKQYVREV